MIAVQVSLMFCPPPIILFLNRHPLVAQYDLSALNRVAVGAAPLGPKAEEEFRERCPQAAMGQGMVSSITLSMMTSSLYPIPLPYSGTLTNRLRLCVASVGVSVRSVTSIVTER